MAIGSAGLAVFAAASFAVYTIALERGMERARLDADVSPTLGAAFISTFVAVLLFWALAFARGIPMEALTVGNIAPFLIAGIAYPGLFRVLFYEGIDRIGAGLTAAVAGSHPAIAAVFAVLALGEAVTLLGGLGIALVVVGVVLLQLTQGTEGDADLEDVLKTRLARARPVDLLFPLGATVALAGSLVLIKWALDRFPDTVTATAITQLPALLIFAGWVLVAAEGGDQLRVDRWVLFAYATSGVFIVLGWLGQFFALRIGEVVTVVPLLNAYPLVVVGITYALARQVPRSPRILGAVVAIIVGATLVQAS